MCDHSTFKCAHQRFVGVSNFQISFSLPCAQMINTIACEGQRASHWKTFGTTWLLALGTVLGRLGTSFFFCRHTSFFTFTVFHFPPSSKILCFFFSLRIATKPAMPHPLLCVAENIHQTKCYWSLLFCDFAAPGTCQIIRNTIDLHLFVPMWFRRTWNLRNHDRTKSCLPIARVQAPEFLCNLFKCECVNHSWREHCQMNTEKDASRTRNEEKRLQTNQFTKSTRKCLCLSTLAIPSISVIALRWSFLVPSSLDIWILKKHLSQQIASQHSWAGKPASVFCEWFLPLHKSIQTWSRYPLASYNSVQYFFFLG